MVNTDSAGVAHFPVIQWEGNVGLAELRASAAKLIAQGELVIQQQVAAEPQGSAPSPALTGAKGMGPGASTAARHRTGKTRARDNIRAIRRLVPMAVPTSSATAPDMERQTSPSGVTLASGNTTQGTGVGPHSRRNRWLFIAAMCASAGLGAMVALLAH